MILRGPPELAAPQCDGAAGPERLASSSMQRLILAAACVGALLPAASGAAEEFVVNGSDAQENEFPFMVSLRNRRGGHDCGATVLAERAVLTAGHCACGLVPPLPTVQYGTVRTSVGGDNIVQVSRVICHEDYAVFSDGYAHNDIAILELARSLPLGAGVAAVPLPPEGRSAPAGLRVRLLGWGLNATDGVVQTTLQKADLRTVGRQRCRALHGGKVIRSNLCAAARDGSGQCSGDSGGPLLLAGVQVGVVSWSARPCGALPGVFTAVASFVPWIQRHLRPAGDGSAASSALN